MKTARRQGGQKQNPKHESFPDRCRRIRNSKQSQMTPNRQKLETSFIRIRCLMLYIFENFVLDCVSDLDIRISNFVSLA